MAAKTEPHERETLGYINILAMFLGFIAGSAGAVPLKGAVWQFGVKKPCNSFTDC